ncbi:MAG: NUDIX domain-containing protein [Chloroflexota bacterium]
MERNKLPVVAHVFLLRSDTVLLARRCDTGFEDGNYGPVGGHVEGNEPLTQAAVRECKEEIGVEIMPAALTFIGMSHYHSPTDEGVDVFFKVTQWKGEPHPFSECDDVRWCPLDKLPRNTLLNVIIGAALFGIIGVAVVINTRLKDGWRNNDRTI